LADLIVVYRKLGEGERRGNGRMNGAKARRRNVELAGMPGGPDLHLKTPPNFP
jgi:hypothetical protein